MKKLLAIVMTLIMAMSMFSLCLYAEEAASTAEKEEDDEPQVTTAKIINPQVDIYKITTAPKRDGVVNPGEYGDKIHTTYEAGKEGEFDYNYNYFKDVDADFYACWDDKNLYLAWVVRTDHHKNEENSQNLWVWNCVQFEVCDRDPRDDGRVVLSLGCAPGTGSQAGKNMKQLYTSGTQNHDTFFRPAMWQFTGKRDDAAKTTTYEVSIPWTTINTVSINGYPLFDTDTTGFAALGGKAKEGTVLGLSYVINDTTGIIQKDEPLFEGERDPEYDEDEMETYVGFWADQRHSVQWGSSIIGGYDNEKADPPIVADSMMAVVTLRGVKETSDSGDGGNQDGDTTPSTSDNPSTSTPTTGTPSTGAPQTGVPSTGVPATGEPTTSVPETLNPITDEPQTPDIDELTDVDPDDASNSLVWLWIVIGVVAAAAIAAIVIVLVKKKGGASADAVSDGAAESSDSAETAPDKGADSDDKKE